MSAGHLLFQGSKERLKRNIARLGGVVSADRQFELIWRSRLFFRCLSYRIRGSYDKTETGYQLRYTFRPTLPTILWVGSPMLYLQYFALRMYLDCDLDAAMAAALYSLIFPGITLWQGLACHKDFRQHFLIATK